MPSLDVATSVVEDDVAYRNLNKVEHIVVLMMENRSFDHMLGFLTIDGGRTDVEGLTAAHANAVGDRTFTVHPASSTKLVKAQDPSHGSQSVAEQIAGGAMSGFAMNYAATRPQPPYKNDSPATVMAYHSAKQLPVYAYLAENFCVCDHWFCSVPGETMPNRCYAVAGSSGGHIDALRPPQPYNLKSFCRHLDDAGVEWRWYSHDYVPMLWLIDPAYGLSDETIPAYFDRKDLFGHRSFVERAAAGDLPAVSWIDPNFVDLGFGPAGSNDDHPPSDLHAGQKLVLELFDAVAQSPLWTKTLLISPMTSTAAFTTMFLHLLPPTTPLRCVRSDHACQRSWSQRGSESTKSQSRSSITPRLSKRSSRASAARATGRCQTWARACAPPRISVACCTRPIRGRRRCETPISS